MPQIIELETSLDINKEWENKVLIIANQQRKEIITEPYKNLSDPNLRKVYDEQFFKKLSEQEELYFQRLENQRILQMVKYGFLFLSYFPIELITRQVSKFDSNSTPLSIVKSIYKHGGILGGVIGIKLDRKPLKFVATASAYSLLMYPLKFLTNVLSVAPFSMTLIQIIKNIILREDQGNGLQFKNLFHAFIPSLFLYGATKLIKISQKALQKKPFFFIFYQYSNEFVQSYLSG
ncbi:hypothetical protein ACTFIZ_003781 [Dictyostelium cf. discoideum]